MKGSGKYDEHNQSEYRARTMDELAHVGRARGLHTDPGPRRQG